MRTESPMDLFHLQSIAFLNNNIASVTKEHVRLKEQSLQCLYLQPILLPMIRYSVSIVNQDLSGEARDGLKLQTEQRTITINRVYSKPLTPLTTPLSNKEKLQTTVATINLRSLSTTSPINAFFSIPQAERIEQSIFVNMYKRELDTSKGPELNFTFPERRGRMNTEEREIIQAYRDDDGYGRAVQGTAPVIRYAIATVLPLTRIVRMQARGHKVEADPTGYREVPRIFDSVRRENEGYENTLRGNLIHRRAGGINEAEIINSPRKPTPGEESGTVAFEKPTPPSGNIVPSEGNVKVEVLADRVYELLERKIRIEKERRGM